MTEQAAANARTVSVPVDERLEGYSPDEKQVIHFLVQDGFIAGALHSLSQATGTDVQPLIDRLSEGHTSIITMLAEAKGWSSDRMLDILDTADRIGLEAAQILQQEVAQAGATE